MKIVEDRFLTLQVDAMTTLWEELVNLLDEEMVKAVMFRFGFKSGELVAEHLNLTEENYLQEINNVLVQTGIGLLSKENGKTGKKISLEIERSFESKIYEVGWGCHFTRGYLAGFFTTTLKFPYYCDEKKCEDGGGNVCRFILEPQGKRG